MIKYNFVSRDDGPKDPEERKRQRKERARIEKEERERKRNRKYKISYIRMNTQFQS